ncbi:hypothetical protein P775_14605 [Puniceibacterium antarcticum]|uniref:Uncharacterized protein n=1 Tax=Puniceibacterium antarcticum TaxID=1206336 RepID=A0A2G8RCW3_9RHOB|nr:hypothetical protein P775_14605 [Puniceibacterium antarcticum]
MFDEDELIEQMFDDLYHGFKGETQEGVSILVGRGWQPYDVLTKVQTSLACPPR